MKDKREINQKSFHFQLTPSNSHTKFSNTWPKSIVDITHSLYHRPTDLFCFVYFSKKWTRAEKCKLLLNKWKRNYKSWECFQRKQFCIDYWLENYTHLNMHCIDRWTYNTHSWESRIISKWIEKILLVSGDYFVFNKRGRPFNYCVIKFKSHRLLQNLHYLYIHTVCFVIRDYVSFCAVYLLKYMVYLSLCRKILYIIKKKRDLDILDLTWLIFKRCTQFYIRTIL